MTLLANCWFHCRPGGPRSYPGSAFSKGMDVRRKLLGELGPAIQATRERMLARQAEAEAAGEQLEGSLLSGMERMVG